MPLPSGDSGSQDHFRKLQSERVENARLYRSEALAAASTRFGAPIRPVGVASWVIVGFAGLLIASATVFLSVGSYARKETVLGSLQPQAGAGRVVSLSTGVVTEVFVKDGELVTEGAPLARISADPMVQHGGQPPSLLSSLVDEGAEREVVALDRVADARMSANVQAARDLEERRTTMLRDQDFLEESLALQRERLRLARETLAAGQALHERQLFSGLQLRQREEAVLVVEQQIGSIGREIEQGRGGLRQLNGESKRIQAQHAQLTAEVALSRAQFDQRHAEHLADHGRVITANKTGKVAALDARIGMTINAGRTVAIILPHGVGLQAELWAPSRAAGFVAPGTPVRLMYDAFPHQKFGAGKGVVSMVAGAPTSPEDLPSHMRGDESLYRILVDVPEGEVEGYGRAWPLTPGMRLSADLVLDERTFWEWLLEPLLALRSRGQA